MLIVGPLIVLVLGLIPIGCKYLSWTVVILAEDDGKIQSLWGSIVAYVILALLGIMLCAAMIYFLGNRTSDLISNVHSGFVNYPHV